VDRIEGQQVGGGFGITGPVVDVHDPEAGPAPEGTEDPPADAPETVDADVPWERVEGEGPEGAPRGKSQRAWRAPPTRRRLRGTVSSAAGAPKSLINPG
jgi:hypothetical protein